MGVGTSLKLQKRLAASVLGCGQRKVWLDPLESSDIGLANSRQNIRRLIKDGLIIKKPPVMHSRARVRARHEAKRKGRHTGAGKRKGTRNARMPRRMLRKYRATDKIDTHLHHELYMKVKGNVFKNEQKRERAIADQAAARRERNKKKRAAIDRNTKSIMQLQREAAAVSVEEEKQKASGQTKKQ